MMETDKATFRKLLTQFLTLSSRNLQPLQIILERFTARMLNNGLCAIEWEHQLANTNMYSESFHRVLKIVHLRHKHMQQTN